MGSKFKNLELGRNAPLKVLIIQENGRHEASVNFRECFCIQRALISLGYECDVWGKGHENFDSPIDFNNYDTLINIENYNSGWVPDFSNLSAVKLLWVIDAHCAGEEVYLKEFERGKYTYMLHATRSFCNEDFKKWIPNSFDETIIKRLEIPKVHDIGFCGNYVNRKPLLDRLSSEIGLHTDIFVIGDKMVEAVNSYKIHFNCNISNDINYRSFETIGCGTLLMTNYNVQYEDLGFRDLENCAFFHTIDEAKEKFHYLNSNPDQIKYVTEKGYELSKEHTYTKRLQEVIELVK